MQKTKPGRYLQRHTSKPLRARNRSDASYLSLKPPIDIPLLHATHNPPRSRDRVLPQNRSESLHNQAVPLDPNAISNS